MLTALVCILCGPAIVVSTLRVVSRVLAYVIFVAWRLLLPEVVCKSFEVVAGFIEGGVDAVRMGFGVVAVVGEVVFEVGGMVVACVEVCLTVVMWGVGVVLGTVFLVRFF